MGDRTGHTATERVPDREGVESPRLWARQKSKACKIEKASEEWGGGRDRKHISEKGKAQEAEERKAQNSEQEKVCKRGKQHVRERWEMPPKK